ncbi:LysR family transcriptional regulator [Gordonia sp. ABSL11-1]|uniref:LysR family transcriptional regulator n=1 Tax=Gordonia sp. ABSL11-1 TaxID=3053924 RepID=UPI0025737553|nr:LysR family transcriptional regulator [Gordonia sp. ABSL11-1]MDL9948162.1 LysR family transcriptional regulator [Gordonia sp. ABSL11-1]
MELRQLQHFVAVADEGSFTRAAARLMISQPGVSSSIKELERELGAQLLVRRARRVELNEAGRELYASARRVLAVLDATSEQVRRGRRTAKRTLAIGSIPSFAGLDLAALVSKFVAQHPDVDVAISIGFPRDLFRLVHTSEVDLAFVTMPQRQPPDGLHLSPLATYPMVLACPLGHRLADRSAVTLGMLENEVFVDFTTELAARQAVDEAFAASGIERQVRVTCNEIGSLLELVAHGIGLAIVPLSLAQATRVPIRLVQVDEASLVWTVAVATRHGALPNPDAQDLWNAVVDTAKPVDVAR